MRKFSLPFFISSFLLLLYCVKSAGQMYPPLTSPAGNSFTLTFSDGPTGAPMLCPEEHYVFWAILAPTPGRSFTVDRWLHRFTPGIIPTACPEDSMESNYFVWSYGPPPPGGSPYVDISTGVVPDPMIPGAINILGVQTVDYVPRSYALAVKVIDDPNLIQNGDFAYPGPPGPSLTYQGFTTNYQDYSGSSGGDDGHIKLGGFWGEGSPCIPFMTSTTYDWTRDVISHGGTGCMTPGCSNQLNVRGATGLGDRHVDWLGIEHCTHCAHAPGYFWGQNVTLTGNEYYHFSYWVRLLGPCSSTAQLPKIQVHITGPNLSTAAETMHVPYSLLLPYTTCPKILNDTTIGTVGGTPCDNTWYNVSFDFYDSAGGTVFISMYDDNRSADGNDFAIDDIELRHVSYVADTVSFGPKPYTIPFFTNGAWGCSNATVTFTGKGNAGDQIFYQIDDGTGWGPELSTMIVGTIPGPGTFTIPAGGPYVAGTVVRARITKYVIDGCPNETGLMGFHVLSSITIAQAPIAGTLVPGAMNFCNTGESAYEMDYTPTRPGTGVGAGYTWTFTSSDPTIASVSSSGNVTAGPGHPYMGCETATITLDVANFCGHAYATAPVTVCHKSETVIMSPDPTCAGTPTTLTVSGSPGDVIVWQTFDVDRSPGAPFTTGTTTITGTPGTAGSFTEVLTPLTSADIAGIVLNDIHVGPCTYHEPCCIHSLGILPTPTGGYITGPANVCFGDPAIYEFHPNEPVGGIWSYSTLGVFGSAYPPIYGDNAWAFTTVGVGASPLYFTESNICGSVTTSVIGNVILTDGSVTVSHGACDPLPGDVINYTIHGNANATVKYSDASGTHIASLIGTTLVVPEIATAPYTPFNLINITETIIGCRKDLDLHAGLHVVDPTITFLDAPYYVCPGEPYQFQIKGAPGTTATIKSTSGTSFTVSFPGTYGHGDPVTLWSPLVTSGIGEQWCVMSITNGCWTVTPPSPFAPCVDVFMKLKPMITLTYPTPLCPGDMISLTEAPVTGSIETTSLHWSGPSLPLPHVTTWNVHPASVPGTYSVYAIGTNGCMSNIATVTVAYTSPPSATVTASSPTCVDANWNSTLTFTGTPGSIVHFSINGVAQPAITIPASIIVHPLGPTTYTITSISNPSYCPAIGPFSSCSLNPAPITGSRSICQGAMTTLSNPIPGGTWISGNPGIAPINPGTSDVFGWSAGTATISYINPSGCLSTTPITVFNMPPLTGSGGICTIPGTTRLYNSAPGGTWTSSNTSIATVDAAGFVTGIAAGTATITYAFSIGCFTTKTVYVGSSGFTCDFHSVFTDGACYFEFSGFPDGAVLHGTGLCTGGATPLPPITISGGVGRVPCSYGCAPGDYYWSIILSSVDIYTSDGFLACSFPLSCSRSWKTSSNDTDALKRKGEIAVIPNPNTGLFTIQGTIPMLNGTTDANIEVVDMLGKTIYRTVVRIKNGYINEPVNLQSQVTNGIYLLKINNKEYNEIFRVVIER